MKHHKLRIAWSVAWGVVAVLLCVLWVRSYSWADTLAFPVTSTHLLGVGSAQGGMTLIKSEYVPGYFKSSWEFAHDATEDPAIAKVYRPQNRPGYRGILGLGIINSTPFFVVCLPYWFLVCL